MTIDNRGNVRVATLLANRDRAQRVSKIRDQMRDADRVYAMSLASPAAPPTDPEPPRWS